MKTINKDKLNERIAAALLRRSQAMADAVKNMQATDSRIKRNELALRTLQLVKQDRSQTSIKLKQDRQNKTGGK